MSLGLPPAFRRLAPWFQGLDAELRDALAEIMSALLPLMGQPLARVNAQGQEPVGIDNLMRRGSYERLVLSEWLLAEEHPDEFLRRAAQAEHLFLRHRQEEPHRAREILVLFDPSLGVLGAGRLVQAAVFVLLARRALLADAKLRHGIAQVPNILSLSDDLAALRALMAARTGLAFRPDLQAAWGDGLRQNQAVERWWVGGAPGPDEWLDTWCTHRLLIRPAWGDALAVSIEDRHGIRHLELEIPRNKAAKRLLQGAWQAVAARLHGTDPRKALARLKRRPHLLIATDKRELIVTAQAPGEFLSLRLPSTPTGAPRKQQLRTGMSDPAIALSMSGRTPALWFADVDTLTVRGRGPRIGLQRPSQEQLAWTIGQSGLLQSAILIEHGSYRLLLRDRKGRLVSWENDRIAVDRATSIWDFKAVSQDVLRLDQANDFAAIAVIRLQQHLVLRCFRARTANDLVTWPYAETDAVISGVCYRRMKQRWHFAVAVQQTPVAPGKTRSWLVWSGIAGASAVAAPTRLAAPIDLSVLGLSSLSQNGATSMGLLGIAGNRRTVWMVTGDLQQYPIFQSKTELVSGVLSIDGSLLALVDSQQTLIVLQSQADGPWQELFRHV